MFQRLQEKWGVSILRVVLILCTFAIGGSACGYLGRKLMPFLGIENKVLHAVLYVVLVTILWPMCVLIVSIPFGQFNFFRKYLAQLGRKITGRSKKVDMPPNTEQKKSAPGQSNKSRVV